MIFDRLSRLADYAFLGPNFVKAAKFVREQDLSALPAGRCDIDGAELYANVVDRVLTDIPTQWEIHEQYADIHIIVTGAEKIGSFPIERLAHVPPIDRKSDSAVLESDQDSVVTLYPDDFLIALPQDVHKPNIPVTAGERVKKVILKVKL